MDLGGWTAQCYKARLAGSVWRVGASYKGKIHFPTVGILSTDSLT